MLEAAGYKPHNTVSLIGALHDPGHLVAVSAATRLGNLPSNLPSSPVAIAALKSTLRDSSDPLFSASVLALQRLGAREWEDVAIGRLPRVKSSAVRLLVAQALAKAGRSEGWPVVRDSLRDVPPGSRGLAINVVASFDGLKDSEGRIIDVEGELALLSDTNAGVVEATGRALSQVKAARKARGLR